MREVLESRIGKEVELGCEGGSITGKIIQIEGNILELERDDHTFYVNMDKIVIVCDQRDKKSRTTGFGPFTLPTK